MIIVLLVELVEQFRFLGQSESGLQFERTMYGCLAIADCGLSGNIRGIIYHLAFFRPLQVSKNI